MKRIRLGTKHKALVVVASLAAGAGVVYGCIPSPDTSGLPGYDAGPSPVFDANIVTNFDGGDASPIVSEDAGSDSGEQDAGPTTGTIVGVVVDYEQGNGLGVIPGATVAVLNGPSATTDAFGTFTLAGVTAGLVQLNVSNPTDTVNHIAYSNTQTVVTLAGGQTVSVFPVLHEGCYESVTLGSAAGVAQFSDSTMLCPYNLTGQNLSSTRYAALSYQATSFTDPATAGGSLFSGTARVEMIPIAFPQTTSSTTDYSWGIGLPGATTPVETIGAVQIRVVSTAAGEMGDPLAVRSGDTVGVTIGASRTFTAGEGFALDAYDSANGAWSALLTGDGGTLMATSSTIGSNAVGIASSVPVLPASWLALTSAGQPTTCVTGTLNLPTGLPAAGVVVRGVGGSYVGTSTSVTDSNGNFCLTVAAAPSDGGAQPAEEIVAGALVAGQPAGTQGVTNVTTQSGTCATTSTCTNIPTPIQLSPLSGGCLGGTISGTLPAQLNAEILLQEGTDLSSGQVQAGIQPYAYVGPATVSDAGVFCAPGVPGQNMIVAAPSVAGNCNYAGLIAVPVGGSAVSCTTGGCLDGGTIFYNNHCG